MTPRPSRPSRQAGPARLRPRVARSPRPSQRPSRVVAKGTYYSFTSSSREPREIRPVRKGRSPVTQVRTSSDIGDDQRATRIISARPSRSYVAATGVSPAGQSHAGRSFSDLTPRCQEAKGQAFRCAERRARANRGPIAGRSLLARDRATNAEQSTNERERSALRTNVAAKRRLALGLLASWRKNLRTNGPRTARERHANGPRTNVR